LTYPISFGSALNSKNHLKLSLLTLSDPVCQKVAHGRAGLSEEVGHKDVQTFTILTIIFATFTAKPGVGFGDKNRFR
jgi:hypothetical protein